MRTKCPWVTTSPLTFQIRRLPVGPHGPHCVHHSIPTGRCLCLGARPPQWLNSFCSFFKPQINHHLFCKAFSISQAEFNASALRCFFFFFKQISLRITCPVPSRSSLPLQNLCGLPLHLGHTFSLVLQHWMTALVTHSELLQQGERRQS